MVCCNGLVEGGDLGLLGGARGLGWFGGIEVGGKAQSIQRNNHKARRKGNTKEGIPSHDEITIYFVPPSCFSWLNPFYWRNG